jgi:GTP cyclohydrolase I
MKLKKKKMKSKDSLYSNFDEVCLDEINEDCAGVSTSKYLENDDEKIKIIAGHFEEIMKTLGLDLNDDSLKETPERVAKMYVKEIFSGLNPKNKPEITTFENKYQYNKMLVEKNISLYSYCEHHFVPIIGKVHVAYISKGKVIGLSKINRLVQYYAKRPQVQERLTVQIAEAIKKATGTEDVAVLIDAVHLCVASRGIKDTNSSTLTSDYSGKFINEDVKNEFLALVR